ncbi:MAG: 50S ribosomal protein L29 [Dehalococcoidia bacterium]|jgi:large subunit ribosomal protein L29|nr:50S ribosomal protein L29 [Dehalococcoidia bacterium]
MRIDKIRALKPKELSKQLEDAHQELFNLRFRLSTRQLANYSEIRKTKKKIARVKTIMRERELGRG